MIRKVLGRYGMVQFIGAAIRDDWYGHLVRRVAPIVNRLLGKSPEFTDVMLPAINLFRGIPTDTFVRQAYFQVTPSQARAGHRPSARWLRHGVDRSGGALHIGHVLNALA
jgi:hypothetical protein